MPFIEIYFSFRPEEWQCFMVKRWIRIAFGFSRKETNGFLILLPLLALILFSEPAYRMWISNQEQDFSQEQAFLDSLVATWQPQEIPADSNTPVRVFTFNPNETEHPDFLKLGFSEELAHRILHYREKGGRFRTKSDLLKIYGMDSTLYNRLYPYVELPLEIARTSEKKFTREETKKPQRRFDLNRADTIQLKAIYGIGQVLSSRIIKFREVLGGFIDMSQLYEVYGLDSVVVKRLAERAFIEENFQPRKMDLNAAGEEEFSIHPYISKSAAKALVAYRFGHGNFTRVEDIRKVYLINDENYRKIMPYLTVNE